MITKTIAYVDRVWGHVADRSIHGDMGYSICHASETRNEDIAELTESCAKYALGDGAVKGDDVYTPEDGSFAIYEIVKTEIELDEEDDPLCYGFIISDREVVEVFACATKEVAGWIEEIGYYKNVKFNYRNDSTREI